MPAASTKLWYAQYSRYEQSAPSASKHVPTPGGVNRKYWRAMPRGSPLPTTNDASSDVICASVRHMPVNGLLQPLAGRSDVSVRLPSNATLYGGGPDPSGYSWLTE